MKRQEPITERGDRNETLAKDSEEIFIKSNARIYCLMTVIIKKFTK